MTATTQTPARRILLAGATGLVGRELFERLHQRPATQLTVLLRRPVSWIDAIAEQSAQVTVLRADDFRQLPALPPQDRVLIALGSTMAQAGSRDAFAAVDRDAVIAVARAGLAAGARRLGVVSSAGANPASPNFYARVKGEMEAAISDLPTEHTVIARPSLLMGDRKSLEQAQRLGEEWALRVMQPLRRLMPEGWRPVSAATVAGALLQAVEAAQPRSKGHRVLTSAFMQAWQEETDERSAIAA